VEVEKLHLELQQAVQLVSALKEIAVSSGRLSNVEQGIAH
jgi:uncharacterized tellurite resistance protein B-like protein